MLNYKQFRQVLLSLATSLICSSCVDGTYKDGQGLQVSSQMPSASEAPRDSKFERLVLPLVRNRNQFYSLLQDYKSGRGHSDKERIDTIIKLGIADYAPSWLTTDALSRLDMYYPDFRKQHAGLHSRFVKLAYNLNPMIAGDYQRFRIAQEGVPFALLAKPGTLAMFATVLGTIMSKYPSLDRELRDALTPNANASIDNSGSADNATAPSRSSQTGTFLPADPGDCGPDQHRDLQNAVNKACKIKRTCKSNMSQAELNSTIDLNAACLNSRYKINSICYRGQMHSESDRSISDVVNTIGECHAYLSRYAAPAPTSYSFRSFQRD